MSDADKTRKMRNEPELGNYRPDLPAAKPTPPPAPVVTLSPEAEKCVKHIVKAQESVEAVYAADTVVSEAENTLKAARSGAKSALGTELGVVYRELHRLQNLPVAQQKAVISSIEYLSEDGEKTHYVFEKNTQIAAALIRVVFAKMYNTDEPSRQNVKNWGHALRLALHQDVPAGGFPDWLENEKHDLANGESGTGLVKAVLLASETLPDLKKEMAAKAAKKEKTIKKKLDSNTDDIKNLDEKGVAKGVTWGQPASLLKDFGIETVALIPIFADAANDQVYLGLEYAETDVTEFNAFMEKAAERK